MHADDGENCKQAAFMLYVRTYSRYMCSTAESSVYRSDMTTKEPGAVAIPNTLRARLHVTEGAEHHVAGADPGVNLVALNQRAIFYRPPWDCPAGAVAYWKAKRFFACPSPHAACR